MKQYFQKKCSYCEKVIIKNKTIYCFLDRLFCSKYCRYIFYINLTKIPLVKN